MTKQSGTGVPQSVSETHSALAGIADQVGAVASGDHGDPFAILGMHADGPGGALTVRCFMPQARSVVVVDRTSGVATGDLDPIDGKGFFAGVIDGRKDRFPYRLRAEMPSGPFEFDDAYQFGPVLGDLDVHLLAGGDHLELYRKLGTHQAVMDGVEGVGFAVWAPNASRVSVVGDFSGWDGRRLPMRLRLECGVWELFVPGVAPGNRYKFEVKSREGHLLPLKADPVGFSAEMRPATASIVTAGADFSWTDRWWMENRVGHQDRDKPMSIYECHLGSWARVPDEGDRFLTYDELADRLVSYVADMGFTHVELMPISEHPFDGSWGYQPIGLFAPTSRHGDPAGFARLIDRFHDAGVAVLVDWVPGHFPTDPHGLGQFDGTALYEHADPRQGFHRDWNTLIYNYGRSEVRNFLLANALHWLDTYHVDGLRVDAVASMIYLDYSRPPGEWVPNWAGGNENFEAIEFLKRLNELSYGRHAGAITVAEESTAFPGVSRPTFAGGLGFGYKWNMGWMNDTLNYMGRDPIHRRYHHDNITFGLVYAFSENYILPLSHDEVVHGKGSLIGRMPGDQWQRFANLRAYFGFMHGHPGKKLLFMGGEIAQEREWSEARSLDWHLLGDSLHRGIQALIRDLNRLHRTVPALHERDCESSGFQWIDGGDAERSLFSFLRRGKDDDKVVVVVVNMTPAVHDDVRFGVPGAGFFAEILNTDAHAYGGSGVDNAGGVTAEPIPHHGQPWSIALRVPPLATVFLARRHL